MRSRGDAFSLLELVLVLALLGVCMAMAAPSLMRFARHRQSVEWAADILALTQYAQAQAVREGVSYRLHADPDSGAYWLTAQRQGVFERPATDFGQVFELPAGFSLRWDSPEAAERGYVQFEPDGSHEIATLAVHSPRGDSVRISGLYPTEPFRIIDQATGREARP